MLYMLDKLLFYETFKENYESESGIFHDDE
jgi:hypothetical protein